MASRDPRRRGGGERILFLPQLPPQPYAFIICPIPYRIQGTKPPGRASPPKPALPRLASFKPPMFRQPKQRGAWAP